MEVIELFAGIGAPIMALKANNVPFKSIGISEISKNAIKIYEKIHGETHNFGDITKIDSLPKCDFLHASTPCQSFSSAGKGDGLKGESGLILDFFRLMENYFEREELPKFISFENVPNLKEQEKFKDTYELLINNLTRWGYNIYDSVLDARYFNNCTTRRRLFVIAIRKDIDNGCFEMPKEEKITELKMRDFLNEKVDEKEFWKHTPIFHPRKQVKTSTDSANVLGWLETKCGYETQSNRVYDKNSLCPTITCRAQFLIETEDENNPYRRLSEEEFWRIQGFSQEDFDKIKNEVSRSAIVAAVGNSIALNPLIAIYYNLFTSQNII